MGVLKFIRKETDTGKLEATLMRFIRTLWGYYKTTGRRSLICSASSLTVSFFLQML